MYASWAGVIMDGPSVGGFTVYHPWCFVKVYYYTVRLEGEGAVLIPTFWQCVNQCLVSSTVRCQVTPGEHHGVRFTHADFRRWKTSSCWYSGNCIPRAYSSSGLGIISDYLRFHAVAAVLNLGLTQKTPKSWISFCLCLLTKGVKLFLCHVWHRKHQMCCPISLQGPL